MRLEVLKTRGEQEDIQERLDKSPDYLIEDPTLGKVAVVIDYRGENGDCFAFSASCVIKKDGQITRRSGSLGITADDALRGLGLDVRAMVIKEAGRKVEKIGS